MPYDPAPIYLDHHATTPLDPAVTAAMLPWLAEFFANPHARAHRTGWQAAEAVDDARGRIAALIGAEEDEIVFTAGATEANNLAIQGAVLAELSAGGKRRRILTLATEHPSVTGPVEAMARLGFEPVILPVGPDGLVDPAQVHAAVDDRTLLISVMALNNEIGVIQPVAEIASMARAVGALMHCDAVQAVGRTAPTLDGLGADLVSLAAHKLYGPKGIGCLVVRRDARARIAPILFGGGQERGLRPGTLSPALCVGFGAAADRVAALGEAEPARVADLGRRLWRMLSARLGDGVALNGSVEDRHWSNLSLRFAGIRADRLPAALPDLVFSVGSACSSHRPAPSPVLTAIGLDAGQAASTIRIGLGRGTTEADITTAGERLAAAVDLLRAEAARPRWQSAAAAI